MKNTADKLWKQWHDEKLTIRLGISACLFGEQCRYDGSDKRNDHLIDVFGRSVQWIPVCPEVGFGLGTPRPTILLKRHQPHPRLIEPLSGNDLTEGMERYARSKVEYLQSLDIDGYVFKKRSPSCGMKDVPVSQDDGSLRKNGIGIFARILMEKMPDLPVEEGWRLDDPVVQLRFIERVLNCQRRFNQ